MSNQEEQMRRARDMQLQLQLQARQQAIPRFGPAVDGVLWNRMRLEVGADNGQQTPILSILEFALKPGVDIHDDLKPLRKLWEAALRYISSIPGCCAVEWGSRLQRPPAVLVCMIHWDSTSAWQKFQYSLGSIGRLLSSSASNRCARLSALGMPKLGDARDAATVVDVVTVTLDNESASSPERRSAFEGTWNALVALASNEYEALRISHAVWLENNASIFFNPTAAEAAAAAVSTTFKAFLAWDGARYESYRVEGLCDNLRASLSSPYGNGPIISTTAFQIINQAQPGHHSPPRQPAAPITGLSSLLQLDIPQQCGADLANLSEHGQQALDRSINDARAGLRLFPAPRGSFVPQGELYDDRMPSIPEWRSTWGPVYGYHLVDVVWVQLKRAALRAQSARVYQQLSTEIGALPGFVKAFWARDVEDKTKFCMLIVWEDQNSRAAVLHEYQRILDDFATSSAHLAAPLTHQTFPMARSPVDLWFGVIQHFELTSFYVPPGAAERQLFEHAYGAFARMTEPSVVAGIPVACRVMDAGGWQPADATEGSDLQLFTAIVTWASPAARKEWYEELFRLSYGSYELFGHTIDTLKIMASGGYTTRFVALQR